MRRRGGDAFTGSRQRRRIGLNLVQTLSERWGTERAAAGGTRVWAQLLLTPSTKAVIAG